MLDPAEQIHQHQAQFQTRQMSASAEMLALAEGDVARARLVSTPA